nr:PIN domain-containing protein [Candidatus Sigynarchaeota archaeon]
MDVVIDANVLFSILIKTSITSRLIFDDRLKLFAPEFILEELEKYKSDLLEKTSLPEDFFIRYLSIVRKRITIVPKVDFSDFLQKGKEISPDPDDHVYFALALKLDCGIWTHDKAVKEKQNQVKIYETKDILAFLK